MKKYIFILVFICTFFCGCQRQQKMEEIQLFAMDTFIDLKASGENAREALLKAEKEINQLEKLFSTTLEQSEVAQINQNAGQSAVTVSEDSFCLIQKAKEYYQQTDGAFDITIAPVVKAWGFTEENKRVPSEEELQQKLQLVDNHKIHMENNTVFLEQQGMAIDLGGIAKGYASDKINEILKQEGITSAVLNLGGNVSVIGKKENHKWQIGIQDPLEEEKLAGILSVEDCSIITSGVYQRFFEQDGKRYHHIIDSKTGKPAETGLLSVTIISKNGTMADALSTSFMIMGMEKSIDLWKKSDNFSAIFITDKNEIYVTQDIVEDFCLEQSNYRLHIIEK